MLSPIQDLRNRLAYFDKLFGPDGDCGDSCMFVLVNDLREIVKMIPEPEATGITAGRVQ